MAAKDAIVNAAGKLRAREAHAYAVGAGLTLLAWYSPKASGLLWSTVAALGLAAFTAKKLPVENKYTEQIKREPHYYLGGVATAIALALLHGAVV